MTCPICRREHQPNLPSGAVADIIARLIARYGSVKWAGRAYDQRFRRQPGSGERLLLRHRNSEVSAIRASTFDRLETLLWQ